MRDTNLVNALREHAEWARANEWETPITLGDDLVKAADRVARYRRRPAPEHARRRAGRGAVLFPDGSHHERPFWCFDNARRLA